MNDSNIALFEKILNKEDFKKLKNNPSNKEIWDKIESAYSYYRLRLMIKHLIERINLFNNIYKKIDDKNLFEIYSWFFYTNLLDLYTFSDVFKIHDKLNEFNPFYVWCKFFNSFKHLKMAIQMVRCDFEKNYLKIPYKNLTYKNRDDFNENNNSIFNKLRTNFYDDLKLNSNISIEDKIKKWLEIKDFLMFILSELPENDILINTETDFYKNRFQLWKFYLEKTNKK